MFKKFILVVLMVFLVLSSSVIAEEIKPFFYGFASLIVPTSDDEEFSFSWARVGLKANNNWLQFVVEYDVSKSDVKCIYGKIDKEIFGGIASLLFGKFLNPIPYLYPGPKTIHLTRWTDALDDISIYSTGFSLWFKKGDFTFRGAHYNHNKKSMTIGYSGLSLLWEQNVCCGIVFGSPWTNQFLHPFMGFTKYEDGRKVFFLQNHFQLLDQLRLYAQVDFGDTKNTMLIGINYEFDKNSFLKVFYETRDEKLLAVITFAFN